MALALENVRGMLQQGYRYAVALSHDAGRAEDLVQDGWLRVLASGGEVTTATLFRAIYCRFVDLHRRARRLRFEDLAFEPAAANLDGADESWCAGVSPRALEEALGRLLPEERAITYLAHAVDWPIGQIAEMMEWPRGTVLSVLHRARRQLREELDVRRTVP